VTTPLRHTIESLSAAGRLPRLAPDQHADHYRRHEALVDAMACFADVAEHLTPYDRDKVLALFLPDVDDLDKTWCELGEPLEQYQRMDGHLAVSIEQERGVRFPNCADSYARIRDELRQEIGAVIRRHRNTRIEGNVA
jgi:hypothetical protein